MCTYCYLALGTVVGGVALAKAGGLNSLSSAARGFVARLRAPRR